MTSNEPGWAVELQGDKIDLDDCRAQLALPFDPWAEDYQTGDGLILLRSATWTKFTEAADVFRDATRILERLNGAALLIHSDARPLKLGQTMRFGSNGKREPIIFAATAHFKPLPVSDGA